MQTALSSFVSSLDETRRIWARQDMHTYIYFKDSYFSSSILERFENALDTVNYSTLPHSQDYLAPGNKHATDKIAAELCIHAFYRAMNVACGVACLFSGFLVGTPTRSQALT